MKKYYNEALIGIEVNYSLQPTMYLAEKLNYSNLYVRERLDSIKKTIVKAFGFETNSKTRPVIISDLQTIVREDVTVEVDTDTLREMLTFIKNDKGKAEAQIGSHDDLIMALAIAHYISSQQTASWIEVEREDSSFISENFHFNTEAGNNSDFMQW